MSQETRYNDPVEPERYLNGSFAVADEATANTDTHWRGRNLDNFRSNCIESKNSAFLELSHTSESDVLTT